MKDVLCLVAMMAGVAMVVFGLPKAGIAADNVSYSGRYSAQRPKNAPSGSTDSVLEVVQSEDSIEITRVELAKRTTSRCPFHGSEGAYTSPGGVSGKCKAELKEKTSLSTPLY